MPEQVHQFSQAILPTSCGSSDLYIQEREVKATVIQSIVVMRTRSHQGHQGSNKSLYLLFFLGVTAGRAILYGHVSNIHFTLPKTMPGSWFSPIKKHSGAERNCLHMVMSPSAMTFWFCQTVVPNRVKAKLYNLTFSHILLGKKKWKRSGGRWGGGGKRGMITRASKLKLSHLAWSLWNSHKVRMHDPWDL